MTHATPAQQTAIQAQGNVLVVAGAGTGKTRTLVDRCLAILEQGESLEHLMLVTFTEAAAREMRQRLRDSLTERMMQVLRRPDPSGAEEWQRQLALLDTARICTLHAFCLELVRAHFHLLTLDPELAVLDEAQTGPLRSLALESVLERVSGRASARSAAVRRLIHRYAEGSEAGLRKLIWRIHRYTQSLPDPQRWIERQCEQFGCSDPEIWRRALAMAVQDWRHTWEPEVGSRECFPRRAEVLAAIRSLSPDSSLAQRDAVLRQVLDLLTVDRPRSLPEATREILVRCREEAEFLLEQAEAAGEVLTADWNAVREDMVHLLRLSQEFAVEFNQAKQNQGGVDFADLEQYALRLLWDPGSGTPSAVAEEWRARLHFIFVDEYQDINAAQDAILRALSREGAAANRFLVGDLKQSIYRFRLANPRIFAAYEEKWRSGTDEGRCLDLADNFRSRESLLEFVNALFAALMRRSVGGVDYPPEAALRFGDSERRAPLSLQRDASPCVELHLLAKSTGGGVDEAASGDTTDASEPSSAEREARLVAHRLRELRETGHPVWDPVDHRFRAAAWRDMAVLLRSPAHRVEEFAKAFQAAGVPLTATRGGFFRSLEVTDLLGLLKLLDNPLQDLPLLAVLRSPLVGLSLDEMAAVRRHSDDRPFWVALRRFHREIRPGVASSPDSAAWLKIDAFLQGFERWREQVRQEALSRCLETVLLDTAYEPWLLAGSRGAERVAQVRRLVDLARQYDPYRRQGLHRFLRFVEAQEEEEVDWESVLPSDADAVQLMSIHRSKGLEFPIVVLAGLGTGFNYQDLRASVLFRDDLGLCPQVLSESGQARYPSLAHWLAARRERRELLGEEMRLLYVALTRARDTLVLVGTCRHRTDGAVWSGEPDCPVRDHEILGARSSLDWLERWLALVTGASDWTGETTGSCRLLRWRIHGDNTTRMQPESRPNQTPAGSSPGLAALSEAALGELRRRLEWRYPFAAATLEHAKTSVSALRRRTFAEADDEARVLDFVPRDGSGRQRSAGSRELSAAEIGTAHHRFLQWMSLEGEHGSAGLSREARRLQSRSILTTAEVGVLDFPALADFWSSDVGRRILAAHTAVRRELPFTVRLSPKDLVQAGVPPQPGLTGDEFIVVQGVADLVVLQPEAIALFDLKTDDVQPSEVGARAARYRPQLELYSLALGRIYDRPVRARWLHFLKARETVLV